MAIRTISRLPECSEISSNDLICVSKQITQNSYSSMKMKLSSIERGIYNDISSSLEYVYQISSGTIPKITSDINDSQLSIQNLSSYSNNLNTKIDNIGQYKPNWNISSITSYIAPEKVGKVVGTGLYSLSVTPNTRFTNEITVNSTGNFFCYGWITAPLNIDPTNAWIGIECLTTKGDWALISLQPWVVGSKSSIIQYVGFNCPVQAGMKIRIVTGFLITDYTQSFAGRGLVININSSEHQSNLNNSFIGYVLC